MAAGYVSLSVLDGGGVARTVKFWSSDGTLTGVLQASSYLGDGDNVSQGAVADAAVTNPASSGSVIALLKGILTKTTAVVLAAGSAIIGKVGIDQTTPGTTNAVVDTLPAAGTAGLLGKYASVTNTVTNLGISAAAHDLYSLVVGNVANAAVTYLQIFDNVTGSVTVGTTPPTYVIPLPIGGGSNLQLPFGLTFTTGICCAATTTPTGSTAPSSNITVNAFYK